MSTQKIREHRHDDERRCDLLVTEATGPEGGWFFKEGPYANRCAREHPEPQVEAAGVKYPEIEVQLTGQDGNAFAIMGAVSGALRRHGVPKEEIDAYTKESMSGDYDHLLQTAMRWVSVS